MASPVVQDAAESSTNTAGTSHVIVLPAGITAGDLLLIIMNKGTPAASSWAFNTHADYNELLDEDQTVGLSIWWRKAVGGESNPTLVSAQSIRSASITYRISGAEDPTVRPPEIGNTAGGSSATPDPPVSATPDTSRDFLFIAFYGAAGEEIDDDTWSDTPPTNYVPSPPRTKACGTAGTNLGGMIAASTRQLTTGSAENPGTFAKDVSASWRAQTIMIYPAGSGGAAGQPIVKRMGGVQHAHGGYRHGSGVKGW